jgi:hypothetical protein
MNELLAMGIREHGHKSPLGWALAIGIGLVTFLLRLIFTSRRRRQGRAQHRDESSL